MDVTESQEESARIVRLVLPLMTKNGIPITPKNYTTWYYYVSGKNKELQETIDSIIDEEKHVSRKNKRNALSTLFCKQIRKYTE